MTESHESLFRHEALDFNREKSLGEAVIARSPSRGLLTFLSAAVAASLVAFVFLGQYTRKAQVPGYLTPDHGLIKVYAQQAGTLVESHVVEGQRVRRGERLFLLSTERGSRETAKTQAAAIEMIEERRERLSHERDKQDAIDAIALGTARERANGFRAELTQLDAEIRIQEQRTANAARTLRRYRRLLAQDLVSKARTEEHRELWLAQRAREKSLRRARVSLETELGALERRSATQELEAQNRRSSISREIAALEQERMERQSRRTIEIAAPADGTATAILVDRGQTAQPNTLLLSILPQGAILEAQLLVPSRSIGFIEPEQRVSLRYQAFPYQRFGLHHGRVTEISRTLIAPDEASLPIAGDEPAYRVTVALDRQTVMAYANALPLQAGMLLEADVWLDRRRLVEWLFEPLLGIAKRA